MHRFLSSRRLSATLRSCLVCGTLLAGLAGMLTSVRPASSEPAAAAPANELAIQGTCTFTGKNSTWSAKLTPKGNNTYDADYTASWGGKPLRYKGTIKTDWKTDITGEGTNSNGTFQFSGKFGDNGIAKCPYKEVGGRGRSGSLTVTAPARP